MYQFDFSGIRPVFSGHETFPLRYGWLKKAYDQLKHAEKTGLNARELFNKDEAISLFGVGKNMVASIRHWATYSNLINENQLTPFAHQFFADDGLDPWLENRNTLWLLHWYIARNPQLVSYFMLFNFFNAAAFNRQSFNESILAFCQKNEIVPPAASTLKRDIECVIRLYSEKPQNLSNSLHKDTEIIESPLAELNLITPTQKPGSFTFNWQSKSELSPNLFVLAILYFWQQNGENRSSISLESMLYDPLSPGRIFLLNEHAFIEKIAEAEPFFQEFFTWSETAGMRQLIKQSQLDLSTIYTHIHDQFINEYSHEI